MQLGSVVGWRVDLDGRVFLGNIDPGDLGREGFLTMDQPDPTRPSLPGANRERSRTLRSGASGRDNVAAAMVAAVVVNSFLLSNGFVAFTLQTF